MIRRVLCAAPDRRRRRRREGISEEFREYPLPHLHRGGPAQLQLFVSCYSSGSLAAFPVSSLDGALSPHTVLLSHSEPSSGAVPERQESPHVHSYTVAPGGRHAVECDLGCDSLAVYALPLSRRRACRPLPHPAPARARELARGTSVSSRGMAARTRARAPIILFMLLTS